MSITEIAKYEARNVRDWLIMADRGAIALPSFQRSYVWQNQRIADYVKALFENRPTGIFLTLQVAQNRLRFRSRTLKDIEADPMHAKELVLDGQQRLTSLWKALKGRAAQRFYVQVADLRTRDMDVKQVEFYSANSAKGRTIGIPTQAYEKNLVPIDLLLDGTRIENESTGQDPDEPGKIWHWCKEACDGGDNARRKLENAIRSRLQQILLIERNLYYCVLPPDTETHVAIKIFVETNRSSATIKMFDIVVALAEGDHREDLRKRIVEFESSTPVVAYYFDRDEQKMIPQVGEWLLKVACLKIRKVNDKDYKNGLPPKEGNYELALSGLFEGGRARGLERFEKLQENLKAALDFVAQHGGSTKGTLPAWPPVHVIAALQDDLCAIRRPPWRGTANQLISAYLWRSFLTDRYIAQANDRLFRDFEKLRDCLNQIKSTGRYTNLPPIFNDDDHPPPTAADLRKSLQWISRGRLGPAIAAVAMHQNPLDWVTGNRLDANTIRDLEDRRKLDRHHVFPTDYLRNHFTKEEMNHGLNGVLLSKGGNISLGKKAPDVYLKKVLDESHGLSENELRRRVTSHLVPYDALMVQGTPKSRYKRFIRQRAELVANEIKRLVEV